LQVSMEDYKVNQTLRLHQKYNYEQSIKKTDV